MELRNFKLQWKHGALGLLAAVCALDVTVLRAADPTTQAATKLMSATVPDQTSTNRDYRQNRDNIRGRRNRDRGSGYTSLVAQTTADPFGVLKTRSIFVKGNQEISSNSASANSFQPEGALVRKPESSLVFNGVTLIDGEAMAFIEDLTADRVSTVRVGDGIAGGKVSAITFDTLSYAANGKVLNVALGQNLEGNIAVSTSMDSTAGAATTGPTTLPFAPGYIGVGGSSGVITTGMSAEDILARMKAKRQAELNAK